MVYHLGDIVNQIIIFDYYSIFNNKYPIEKTHEISEREHEGIRENTFHVRENRLQ